MIAHAGFPHRFAKTVLALTGLAAGFGGLAHAEVTARQLVEQEVLVTDENGAERLTRRPAEAVAPGEEVIYTLDFSNDGAAPAENVVLVMPVPSEIAFMEGSVTGENAAVTFSAAGGATYVARGRLTVRENGAARAARSDEITHVRWIVSALAPSETGSVSFRGVLK